MAADRHLRRASAQHSTTQHAVIGAIVLFGINAGAHARNRSCLARRPSARGPAVRGWVPLRQERHRVCAASPTPNAKRQTPNATYQLVARVGADVLLARASAHGKHRPQGIQPRGVQIHDAPRWVCVGWGNRVAAARAEPLELADRHAGAGEDRGARLPWAVDELYGEFREFRHPLADVISLRITPELRAISQSASGHRRRSSAGWMSL